MKTGTYRNIIVPFVLLGLVTTTHAQNTAPPPVQPQTPLTWAYALNTPGLPTPVADVEPKRVPGSELAFSFTQPRNLYAPPDWHPEDHPEMPPIVAAGRNPGIFPCSYCHLPNGQGRPENASLVGLPAEYIMQQMADYRAGLRMSSEPQMGPPGIMRATGLNATPEEAAAAAAYFSSIKPRRWIRVIEAEMVPETVVSGWMFIEKEGGGMEPIGKRILEMPENLELTELRDSHSGFIAYVPVGSIGRGEALAEGGDGKTRPCAFCHGEGLKGLGPIPALAGRSPSYIARQLYDLQSGNRKGLWSPLMADVVANLTPDDMLNIAAFTASLEP